MRYFLLALLLVSPTTALADSPTPHCKRHPIYCKIVELRPDIDRRFAMELSNYIHKASKHFKTDPMVSVAIAMQESAIRNINRHDAVITPTLTYVEGVSDIGIFQIHVNTVKYYNINPDWLMHDIQYQVWQHTKILRKKMDTCKTKGWEQGSEWVCYHSYTKKHRAVYKKLVNRYR